MQGEAGQGGSKKSKLISILPHGAGLKSHPIPVPLPLWGGDNPREMKQGGLSGARQNDHP